MNEIQSLACYHGNKALERKENVNWATWETKNPKSIWVL